MTKRIQMMALVLVLASATAAHAAIENAGTTAGNFLSVGPGAGVSGMGGATLALPSGLLGAAWNPAALARLDHTELMVSHAGLDNQTAQEWFGVGGRFATSSTHWSLTGLYHGQGSFEGRDATGVSTGDFGVSDMALGAHVARRFGPAVSVGLGAKYVSEVLDDVSGSGVTFDGGLQVHAGMIGFGVAAQNLGGRMNYGGASFPFPSNYGVGASLELPTGVRMALDANFPKAYYNDVRGGIEWRYRGLMALRAGYRKELGSAADERLTGPTFGFGGGVGSMWFDYGYVVPGQGDGQHRFGLTLRPGSMRSIMRPLASESASPAASEPVAKAEPKDAAAGSTPSGRTTSGTRSADAPVADGPPAPTTLESAPSKWRSPGAEGEAPRAATLPAPGSGAASVAKPVPAAPPVAAVIPVAPKPAPAAKPSVSAPAPKPVVATPVPPPVPAAAVQVASGTALEPTREARPVTPRAPVATAPKAIDAPRPVLPEPTAEPAPVAVSVPAPAAAPAPSPVALVSRPASRVAPVTTPASAPLVIQRPARVKVKGNETMADIARQWGTSVAAIMMENNLVTDRVRNGQELKLPKK